MKITAKSINWLNVAGIVTVGYVIWLAHALGWTRLTAFLGATTALNEVGDFLAGVFAPIALIWLVAAVLTQRQELTETRDQFAENQKVVDEQLKTIRSQNALLNQQHIDARENAKEAYKLNLFDKRMAIYQRFMAFDEMRTSKDYTYADFWSMKNLSQEAAFVFDQSIERWLEEIADKISAYNKYKTAFPLELAENQLGGRYEADTKGNEEIRARRAKYTAWIAAQFLPENRISKFWKFMHVSDHPFMGG